MPRAESRPAHSERMPRAEHPLILSECSEQTCLKAILLEPFAYNGLEAIVLGAFVLGAFA
eukprot:13274344-Alexandrium_andersonii.AAC.1